MEEERGGEGEEATSAHLLTVNHARAVVERFMHEGSSQQEHLSNPYWKCVARPISLSILGVSFPRPT